MISSFLGRGIINASPHTILQAVSNPLSRFVYDRMLKVCRKNTKYDKIFILELNLLNKYDCNIFSIPFKFIFILFITFLLFLLSIFTIYTITYTIFSFYLVSAFRGCVAKVNYFYKFKFSEYSYH